MSWLAQLLGGLTHLVGALEQDITNGVSQWGILPSPNFPPFLGGSPLVNGKPWGNTQPGGSPPNTGVTRNYDWTVTRDIMSPDGFNKSLILINDQFPGPALEGNWGDTFQVTVHNNIVDEGITIHWHGLSQAKTPWFDGVPGVSQCPIAPGSSFTYTFQADTYGTSWYHSHYSGQYGDGLYGPMIIHGPVQPGAEYDFDIGPVILQDYIHDSYYTDLKKLYTPAPNFGFPNLDNNLINGKGAYNCADTNASSCTPNAGFAKFNFTSGKTHRLRLINPSTVSNQFFSIDGHNLTVIANDFVPLVPYTTDHVVLSPGQRTDLVVKGTGKPSDVVWAHSEIDVPCTGSQATNSHGLAAIYYEQANHTAKPPGNVTFPTWPSNNCGNEPLSNTVPYYQKTPPSTLNVSSVQTQTITTTLVVNASGIVQFLVDGSAAKLDYNDPVLLDAADGNYTWPRERNVYDFGSNTTMRIILINPFPIDHPMHLHGHDFWVLAEGVGTWDGTVVNPQNPQRRDTQILQGASAQGNGFLVLEWAQDNPGVWPLHCHLAQHVSAGLYINVLERKSDIHSKVSVPMIMQQTCKDWDAWSSKNFVDQIDSGV